MHYLNNSNLFSDLNAINIVPAMAAGAMFGTGRWIDPDDQKLHQMTSLDPSVNWIYVNPDPKKYCMIYREIEEGFRFIPSTCLNCWKVVVIPRSFHELLQIYQLEKELSEEDPECWCKCGVESRDSVNRHYGGYFYTSSKGEGLRRYKIVREAVNKYVNPQIDILLKRYCTEFEHRYGPSDKYKQPPGAKEIEKEVFSKIEFKQQARKQPEWIRRHVIQRWMLFAWGRADPTVQLYNDSKPLFPKYVTYHPKEG